MAKTTTACQVIRCRPTVDSAMLRIAKASIGSFGLHSYSNLGPLAVLSSQMRCFRDVRTAWHVRGMEMCVYMCMYVWRRTTRTKCTHAGVRAYVRAFNAPNTAVLV